MQFMTFLYILGNIFHVVIVEFDEVCKMCNIHRDLKCYMWKILHNMLNKFHTLPSVKGLRKRFLLQCKYIKFATEVFHVAWRQIIPFLNAS